MSFKENLLKKIEIDKMADTVIASIGPPGSERKTDRQTMKLLLETGGYVHRKERDLDMYLPGSGSGREAIFVLDNELAIYHTTVEDVALRKSPTIKEMVNVRNAIRILNDKDVVASKREVSVETIRRNCIDDLDLSFNHADIEAIAEEGRLSLERKYMDGVIESLSLLGELLGFRPAPKAFKVGNTHIAGKLKPGRAGEKLFGPMVIYSILHDAVKFIEEPVGSFNKVKIEWMHSVAMGRENAPMEGPGVFEHLASLVLKKKSA